MKDNKLIVPLLILGFIFTLAGGLIIGFLYGKYRYSKVIDTGEITSNNNSNNKSKTDSQSDDDKDTNILSQNSNACKNDFCEYNNDVWGISFKYPRGWYIEEGDQDDLIVVTDGNYLWELCADPIFTGGGTGFYIDATIRPNIEIDSENQVVTPASYEGYIVNSYVKGSSIPDEKAGEDEKDNNKWYWNFSQYVVSPNNLNISGFGEGEMYDEISYNFFTIYYSYKASEYFPNDTYMFYLPPERNSEELNEALLLMDGITNSVEIN